VPCVVRSWTKRWPRALWPEKQTFRWLPRQHVERAAARAGKSFMGGARILPMNAMTTAEIVNAVINGVVAVVTILLAILAIWGDAIRHWLASPQMSIAPHRDFCGDKFSDGSGRESIYFFLTVRNSRRWTTAKSVRVLLKRFERRGPDNRFHETRITVPFQFCWSPSELSEVVQNVLDERLLDFGFLMEPDDSGECYFEPKLYGYSLIDPPFVRAGEAARYHLEIVGENFHCPKRTVVEVSWDGTHTTNTDELRNRHLKIKIVPPKEIVS